MKYKILEHTADLKIRAFGKTKEELFCNAMLAMESALRPKIKKEPLATALCNCFAIKQKSKIKNKLRIESENLETLLVDFLNEINYQNETNLEIYNKIIFNKFSDNAIEAELLGQKVKRFGLQIKGVTFHDLDILQKENGTWEATVLFDI